MERGLVKSYNKGSGAGVISRSSNTDVNFSSDNVLGKHRFSLEQGDSVWFEVDTRKDLHVAINIRKT